MKIHNKQIENYIGLGRALYISDDMYELIVTLDIGPRILKFSLLNGENWLADNVTEQSKLPDGSIWKLYGGHRIWHSPEAFPRTYITDNQPVESFELIDDGVIIWQTEESQTHMQKGLQIEFRKDCVVINNQLKNKGFWPIETAVWAITVVPENGQVICPVIRTDTGLLPNACYVTWPYTNFEDNRVNWGKNFIKIKADSQNNEEFKFGYSNSDGWIANFKNGMAFIKQYLHRNNAQYSDFGCSTEIYASNFGIEMETLSPIKSLQPGEVINHQEYWHIENILNDTFSNEGEYHSSKLKEIMIDI